MNVSAAIPTLVGDLERFSPLSDRVEGLVDAQVERFRPKSSDWIVVPWTNGFYLFSEDVEGQRQGREIVSAFLGPSIAVLETVDEAVLEESLPVVWKETGLVKASSLRLVGGHSNAERMVARLEDMVASLGGRIRRALELKPSPTDLLRDFRLALIRRDDDSARQLLDEVRLTAHVSAENLRYLRLEYLAAFERWADMRKLPHLGALLQARRPRAISETLFRMVWWTELVGIDTRNAYAAFVRGNVVDTYGQLLRSIRVPSTPEGRVVGFLCAVIDSDTARQELMLQSATDEVEDARLRDLVSASGSAVASDPTTPVADPVVSAFDDGRYSEVIDSFLAEPSAMYADLAVQAVLESGMSERAGNVLFAVGDLEACGELALSRRTRRDLEDLERLSRDNCAGWLEWAERLGGQSRWPEASSVLRNSGPSWQSLASLETGRVKKLCDCLVGALGGINDDQLRASLDILCHEGALQLARGSANDFCGTTLLLLSEQENFSEMVRFAYLELFEAWLGAGPITAEYSEVLEQTATIWERIRARNAVEWAIEILELTANSSCPDSTVQTNFVVGLINDIRRQFYRTAALRERAELEDIAEQLGLPTEPIEASEVERDLWSKLNGKSVGVYSHLPRARSLLESRLRRLCNVVEVQGNSDEASTAALRSMATRVDYLLVHTWKASHQATAAIDAVRPREEQIFPVQKGVTGFLRALESALSA